MFSFSQQSQSMTRGGFFRGLVALSAAASLIGCLAMQGCTTLGALAYKVTPPPKIQPVYTMPKEKTLVLVENYRNPGVSDQDTERLGREITDQLKKHSIAPVIDPDTLFDYRSDNGGTFDQMSIASIGQALGAKQVLYVDVVDYGGDWTLASNMLHPKATIRVRVVDVKTGNTVWPDQAARGYPMNIELQYAEIKDAGTAMDAEEAICQSTADHVAKLFYAHEEDEVSQDSSAAMQN
jgi:TolB-like protein